MLPSIVKHPYFRITASADPRKEAREKFADQFKAETYDNIEDLCMNADVDAVYIATPHQFHADHVKIASASHKHIIVEKPMALSLEDCDIMIESAERHGVKLVVGHTHSFDPPSLKIRELINSGKMGKLAMINAWNFTNFLYRPRRPEELDTNQGGGIVFNQLPHQIDTIRMIGGGLVKSVRAMTAILDPARPTEGCLNAFLEFADGATATVVYSGYDYFDSDEFHYWIGEGGQLKKDGSYGSARRSLKKIKSPEEEAQLKATTGYGGSHQKRVISNEEDAERFHPHFGTMIVSCEKGDLRSSPHGVLIYTEEGKEEVPVPLGRAVPDKGRVLDEFYDAILNDKTPIHDGRWGKATLEVCLAILASGREKREISLSHQVPVRD
jgi:phthalate 4,5-cis-dihydrodiol dehydrogenase